MKVGILCYPTSGGSGVVAGDLGAALAARGHEVHLLSYRRPFRWRPVSDRFHFHEVRIPQYPLFEFPSYGMAAASTIVDVTRRHGLDLVHAHYAFPHGVSAFLAKEMLRGERELRTITTLHGTDASLVEEDAALDGITRLGIVRSDSVTAVSEALKRRTLAWFGFPRAIEVVPNFVDTARFQPRERRPGPRIVVHVSNFRRVKRSADAVRAFYLLRRRTPAKLWMIGDGPEAAAVRTLAEQLGVAADVEFLGEDRDIHELLPEASALLSTSEYEGFGLAPLEALSCGVPVVATNAGGLPEVVEEGLTGRLVPVGEVEAMAERLLEVFDRPDMAVAARARAVERFDTSVVVPRYEELYRRTLDGAGQEIAHA